MKPYWTFFPRDVAYEALYALVNWGFAEIRTNHTLRCKTKNGYLKAPRHQSKMIRLTPDGIVKLSKHDRYTAGSAQQKRHAIRRELLKLTGKRYIDQPMEYKGYYFEPD